MYGPADDDATPPSPVSWKIQG